MEYRRLGKSGLPVSVLSFGSWVTFGNQLGVEPAMECMKAAYDAGVNFFDNAEVYAHSRSETVMGEALAKLGWRRDSIILSSKVFWGSVPNARPTQKGLHKKHVVEACHQALARLKVDYLDLYYCHRPDPETPIEETVRTMSGLVHQGKVLYWGTSEWSAEQIEEAHGVAREPGLVAPAMEQPQYNLLTRARVEREYAPLYEKYGMGTTTWSPLHSGILTGKYDNGIPADSRMNLKGYEWLRRMLEGDDGTRAIDATKRLARIAKDLDTNLARLAIAWCAKNPRVSTVITGASRVEQVRDNVGALPVMPKLTPDVMKAIDAVVGVP